MAMSQKWMQWSWPLSLGLWLLRLLGLRRRFLLGRPLLLGRLLLKWRLGLLRQWLRRGVSAECRTCGATTANIATARVDRARQMIGQPQLAWCNHDEKLSILKRSAL